MINTCKECGNVMLTMDDIGSNKDGGKNADYCSGCFRSGIFTHFVK